MFDLEKFKQGVPAIDRRGREWTFLRQEDDRIYIISVGAENKSVVGIYASREGVERSFSKDGKYNETAWSWSSKDLIAMKETKPQFEEITLYLNVYREGGFINAYAYSSKEFADNCCWESRLTGKAIPVTVKLPK